MQLHDLSYESQIDDRCGFYDIFIVRIIRIVLLNFLVNLDDNEEVKVEIIIDRFNFGFKLNRLWFIMCLFGTTC